MPAGERTRGFTLLELMVATTLLALLSLTVLIGMRVGFGAWERGQRRLERGAQEEAVQEYFGRAMASAAAYVATPQQKDLPQRIVPFEGSSQGIRWLTTYTTGWRGRSGLTLVECFLAGEGDQRRLVVQEIPMRDDNLLVRQMLAEVGSDLETSRRTVVYRPFVLTDAARTLVTGVRDARFEFLKATPSETAWQAAWNGVEEAKLPAAVRLRVRTLDGNRSWTVPIESQVPEKAP